jgi:hypothetical protein
VAGLAPRGSGSGFQAIESVLERDALNCIAYARLFLARRRGLEVAIVAGTTQVQYSAYARHGKLALRHACHRFNDGVDGFAPNSSIGRRFASTRRKAC